MKKLSLNLFLIFICSIGFAQKPANIYTPKIDSVQNLLSKNPKEDTNKAKIFQPHRRSDIFHPHRRSEQNPLGKAQVWVGGPMPLSLAYDIITKGHGGTIEVETKEGEGTTFIVKLPIS